MTHPPRARIYTMVPLSDAALSEALRAGLPLLVHGEEGTAEGAGDAEGIGERWSTPGF